MNRGQQVENHAPPMGAGAGSGNGGGVPEGRRVTWLRLPVARSSTTICTVSSPPGPGPRSVKAIRRPFGLKAIGGDVKRLKLGSRLAGPRGRNPRPSERTMKNPLCSGDRGLDGESENASFTSNTTADPSGLTPRRCRGKALTDWPPHRYWPYSRQSPAGSGMGSPGPNSTTVIGSRSPRRMRNA
jgi:hypothetical protein